MPPKIRATLTIVVFIASGLLWNFKEVVSLNASPHMMLGLTAFMAAAIWLFPEFKKEADD